TPSDDIVWTLKVDKRAVNISAAARKCGDATELARCPECSAVLQGKPPCWSCGWIPKRRGRDVDFIDGELGLVVDGKAQAPQHSEAASILFSRDARAVQQPRVYKGGGAPQKSKTSSALSPRWAYNDLPPAIPTDAVLRWVRSRQIAYAKALERGAA